MYIPILIFFLNLLLQNNLKGIFNISSDEVISKFNFGKKVVKKFLKIMILFQLFLITRNLLIDLKICH